MRSFSPLHQVLCGSGFASFNDSAHAKVDLTIKIVKPILIALELSLVPLIVIDQNSFELDVKVQEFGIKFPNPWIIWKIGMNRARKSANRCLLVL